MDFISTLSDDMLCHILSFLPTRTAISTSSLSRRWRHLWKNIRVLDLEHLSSRVLSNEEAANRFTNFINAVLSRHNASRLLKFRLSGILNKWNDVTPWIERVTGPNLNYLCLSVRANEVCIPNLPFCTAIFTCSLVSLDLEGNLNLHKNLPTTVHLPSLKNLRLSRVMRVDLEKILLGCPILEILDVFVCRLHCLDIHMPTSLKSLKFKFEPILHYVLFGGTRVNKIQLAGLSLEYLQITVSNIFSVTDLALECNLLNVGEVHLDIGFNKLHVVWVPKLLSKLCETKLLVLGDSTVECLLHASAFEWPEFSRLHNLELQIHHYNWGFLINLLHCCHMLQVLTLHYRKRDYTLYHERRSLWRLPRKDPDCVISHLKIFEFKGYKDTEDEHAFVVYLLKRGSILQTVKIHDDRGYDLQYTHRLLLELSSLPRRSKICKVKVFKVVN